MRQKNIQEEEKEEVKYIEISDGVSLRVDSIEAVERKDELTSLVRTNFNAYESMFPYSLLLEMLGREEPTQVEKETINILKEIGTPAH